MKFPLSIPQSSHIYIYVCVCIRFTFRAFCEGKPHRSFPKHHCQELGRLSFLSEREREKKKIRGNGTITEKKDVARKRKSERKRESKVKLSKIK